MVGVPSSRRLRGRGAGDAFIADLSVSQEPMFVRSFSPLWWETVHISAIRAVVFALVVGNVHISAHSCGRFRAYGGKRYASGHCTGSVTPDPQKLGTQTGI
jgi:hypothetical protein